MAEIPDDPYAGETPEQRAARINAQINEAKRRKEVAQLKRDPKSRRAVEQKQRKGKVNMSLLRGQGKSRDELWTIRGRSDLIRQVKSLAVDLSEPGAKVSVAALMEEAMELLLAHYAERGLED